MKTILIALNCYLAMAWGCLAAVDLYGPYDTHGGRFTLAPVVSYRTTEWAKTTDKLGGGLALSFMVANNLSIEASAISYNATDTPSAWDTFDEGAVNLKGYLPLRASGFAPYGFVGYTRDHQFDDNLGNIGVGLAYRWKFIEASVDAQGNHTFENRGAQMRLRASLGIRF